MKIGEALMALGDSDNKLKPTAKSAVAISQVSDQVKIDTPGSEAFNWKELCPELAKLEKTLKSTKSIRKVVKRLDDNAVLLNRWGHPDAHTLAWMEADALARVRMVEEFARTSTKDLSKSDATTLAVQKQALDDEFVLDQGCSTGQTDRVLREQDRKTIVKAHGEAGVSLRSEYMRRNSRDELDGPLDMGFTAVSDLDQ